MAQTLSVNSGYVVDNTQRLVKIIGTLSATGTPYPVGGIPLDSVLLALPEVTTNSGVLRCSLISRSGTGYIYQRIAATGKLMVLQVPPSGSLTTATPLQQFDSAQSTQGINNDLIDFEAYFKRNS
jgi:hypothetical protein